jgi:hypothetical protein
VRTHTHTHNSCLWPPSPFVSYSQTTLGPVEYRKKRKKNLTWKRIMWCVYSTFD